MRMEQYELPAHWASALINGDDSGLEEEDLIALEKFERYMALVYKQCWCVDVGEETWFSNYHDATKFGVLPCDVALFTFDITKG